MGAVTAKESPEQELKKLRAENAALRTAQKQREEIQAENENLYRLIVEAANEGIWVIDPKGQTIFTNKKFADMLGYTIEEMMTKSAFDLMDEEGQAIARLKLQQRSLGLKDTYEHKYLCKDGSPKWMLVNAAPRRDNHDRYLGSLVMLTDITERKIIEEERERHLAAVAEANEAKDIFFNTLSHELRTPLAAIINANEVLRQENIPENLRKNAQAIIERNVHHQTRLIDDLLNLSRIMRGKLELKTEVVDLRQIVSTQVEAMERGARRNGLELTLKTPKKRQLVNGDIVRLNQIVGNLINNAIKFTDPGGRIDILVEAQDKNVLVRVKDTGIGIEPEFIRHIFTPFRQADATLARKRGGLGIGLALAYSLTESHGGTLEVKSAGLNQGSEFILRLQIVSTETHASLPMGIPVATASRRVLLVEDNSDLRMMMTILLTQLGHQVISGADAAAGLTLVKKEKPDVAFIDIGLPGIDGYEMAKLIRREFPQNKLQLVALTGFASQEHQLRAAHAGFDCFLKKPVELSTLKQVLAGEVVC